MADELIDIYDEENNFTGKSVMKSEAHRDGLFHRVIHVIVYNSKGEILLQLRSKNKILYSNLWDISAAGHVGFGEDIVSAAARETFEEVGIRAENGNFEFYRVKKISIINNSIKNNEFGYVYFLRFDGDLNKLKVQKEEVQKIAFVSVSDLKRDLITCPENYCPYGEQWDEIIGEIQKRI